MEAQSTSLQSRFKSRGFISSLPRRTFDGQTRPSQTIIVNDAVLVLLCTLSGSLSGGYSGYHRYRAHAFPYTPGLDEVKHWL